MSSYQRILLVLDNDLSLHEPAIAATARIADVEAEVHILIPVYDPAAPVAESVRKGAGDQIQDLAMQGSSTLARDAVQKFSELGIKTSHDVRWDRRTDLAALEAAQRLKSDLIIKTGALTEQGPDVSDRNILRSCVCPVYLVRTQRVSGNGSLAASIDLVRDDDRHRTLNRTVLQHAQHLASAYGKQLHVVVAYPSMTTALPMMEEFAGAESLHQEIESAYRKRAEAMLHCYDCKSTVHVREGRPATVISDIARELGSTPIVTGTIARTGIAGLAVGNTIERLLENSDQDVFCVKGEDIFPPSELEREMGRV